MDKLKKYLQENEEHLSIDKISDEVWTNVQKGISPEKNDFSQDTSHKRFTLSRSFFIDLIFKAKNKWQKESSHKKDWQRLKWACVIIPFLFLSTCVTSVNKEEVAGYLITFNTIRNTKENLKDNAFLKGKHATGFFKVDNPGNNSISFVRYIKQREKSERIEDEIKKIPLVSSLQIIPIKTTVNESYFSAIVFKIFKWHTGAKSPVEKELINSIQFQLNKIGFNQVKVALKNDRVYFVKEDYRDHLVAEAKRNNNRLSANKPTLPQLPEVATPSRKSPASTKPRANTSKKGSSNGLAGTKLSDNTNTSKRSSVAPKVLVRNEINKPFDVAKVEKDKLGATNNNELLDKGTPANNNLADKSKLNEVAVTSLKDSSLVPTPADTAKTLVKQQTNDKPNKNYFASKPPQARVGVGFDLLGLKQVSVGPVVEVFLLNNFSFNTGLLFGTPEEVFYETPQDFLRLRGKRFRDEFSGKIVPGAQIGSIEIDTKVLRLPLSVNYYLPIKGSLSFLISGGTHLDLSVARIVEYQITNTGRERTVFLEDKPKPITFNNFKFDVGVQYQLGRFVGQLSPYYNYQFKTTEYTIPRAKIGLSTDLKFNLKK